MIPGFPHPYPDELVGSLIARAVRHTSQRPKALIEHLSGSRRAYASWLLSALITEIAHHAGIAPRRLLWEHTVFPYSTAYLAREWIARVESSLLERPMQAPWSAVPLTQSVTQGLSHRRYCAACSAHDKAELGETYWHRKHNLPGVYRCPVHGTPLLETQLSVRKGMHRFTSAMPGEVMGYKKTFSVPIGVLADVARRSHGLLRQHATDRSVLVRQYRERVDELGMIHGPFAASREFVSALLGLYGHAYLAVCGADFTKTAKSPWPALMLRSQKDASVAPIKHVLIQSYLAFATPTTSHRRLTRPGPKPRDRAEIDRALWGRLCADIANPHSDAGLAPIQTWLTSLQCWEVYRHSRRSLPLTGALVAALRDSRRANITRLRARRMALAPPQQ